MGNEIKREGTRATAGIRAGRPDYGFDAPLVPALMGLGAVVLLALGAWMTAHGDTGSAAFPLLGGVVLAAQCGIYVHTTRSGKSEVWSELLEGLHLRGDETILDMGCGRGAVLLRAAGLVPRGHAVGLDIWQKGDQSGNDLAATRANAEREGLSDRVELYTGDMREMPLPDSAYDVVVSSLAIHHIHGPGQREKAIVEAVRVLKAGGRLLIADLPPAARGYAQQLRELSLTDVSTRSLGWRFWYGGPWMGAHLVQATKA